jgi:hypothetical protein
MAESGHITKIEEARRLVEKAPRIDLAQPRGRGATVECHTGKLGMIL